MPGQDVQDHTGGIDVVRQRLGASGFHRFDPIGQHGTQDVDHLPITTGLTFQFTPHAADGHRQLPFLERCPVAKGTGLACQDGNIMQGIKDGFVAPEGALVLTNDLAVLPALQPIGISSDLHRPADRPGIDRVAVRQEKGPPDLFLFLLTVEPNEAGL